MPKLVDNLNASKNLFQRVCIIDKWIKEQEKAPGRDEYTDEQVRDTAKELAPGLENNDLYIDEFEGSEYPRTFKYARDNAPYLVFEPMYKRLKLILVGLLTPAVVASLFPEGNLGIVDKKFHDASMYSNHEYHVGKNMLVGTVVSTFVLLFKVGYEPGAHDGVLGSLFDKFGSFITEYNELGNFTRESDRYTPSIIRKYIGNDGHELLSRNAKCAIINAFMLVSQKEGFEDSALDAIKLTFNIPWKNQFRHGRSDMYDSYYTSLNDLCFKPEGLEDETISKYICEIILCHIEYFDDGKHKGIRGVWCMRNNSDRGLLEQHVEHYLTDETHRANVLACIKDPGEKGLYSKRANLEGKLPPKKRNPDISWDSLSIYKKAFLSKMLSYPEGAKLMDLYRENKHIDLKKINVWWPLISQLREKYPENELLQYNNLKAWIVNGPTLKKFIDFEESRPEGQANQIDQLLLDEATLLCCHRGNCSSALKALEKYMSTSDVSDKVFTAESIQGALFSGSDRDEINTKNLRYFFHNKRSKAILLRILGTKGMVDVINGNRDLIGEICQLFGRDEDGRAWLKAHQYKPGCCERIMRKLRCGVRENEAFTLVPDDGFTIPVPAPAPAPAHVFVTGVGETKEESSEVIKAV